MLETDLRADLDLAATVIATGRVLKVNVSPGGVPKRPVDTAHVGRLGLEGDAHDHFDVHGGPNRAVCLFAVEAIRRVAAEGHPIAPGSVGENLTTEGVELATLAPGTRLTFPSGLELEVSAPANPCDVIKGSFLSGKSGRISILRHPLDSRVYARVLHEGEVAAGDALTVLPPRTDSQAGRLNLLERLDANERRFWLATWGAVAAAGADLRILDLGDAVACAAPGSPGRIFNAAFGLRMVPILCDRVIDHFRANGMSGWLGDIESPAPGLEPAERVSVLAIEPHRVPAAPDVPGLLMREVGVAEAEAWERIVLDGFDLQGPARDAWQAAAEHIARIPGMHLVLAAVDGQLAGAAGLFARARVGGLAPAAVLPGFRGRGIHAALIAARARMAEEKGCELITAQAETDGQSEHNMRRMGLARVHVRDVHRVDPA
jgi:MOSC domain-containing protein YiiM/GNAT superfamily N-acetyltransferase